MLVLSTTDVYLTYSSPRSNDFSRSLKKRINSLLQREEGAWALRRLDIHPPSAQSLSAFLTHHLFVPSSHRLPLPGTFPNHARLILVAYV